MSFKESHNRLLVKNIISAVEHTLRVQCRTDAKVLKPFLKDAEGVGLIERHCGLDGLISQISLDSSEFKGTLSLCFEKKVYIALINKMIGEDYKQVTKENEDGIGELLNIIFGFVKMKLNDTGSSYSMARPTIRHTQLNSVSENSIVLLFKSDVGYFHVELNPQKVLKVA